MSRSAPSSVRIAERGALILILAVFLAPIVWMVSTAYKPASDIFSIPPTFWFTPTLANFRSVFIISI
jgi:multiple sugar transport system permease protein